MNTADFTTGDLVHVGEGARVGLAPGLFKVMGTRPAYIMVRRLGSLDTIKVYRGRGRVTKLAK
jgi:hypothetical protein